MNTLRRYYDSRKWFLLILLLLTLWVVCRRPHKLTPYQAEHITTIKTGKTTPYQLVSYACTLEGTPYLYASTNPRKGFDCSGFVTYVFKHFDITVPRVSTDFTPVQHPVPLRDAKMGDLILFTGSDSTDRVVGHMGIISSIPGEPLKFIHASSGKSRAVVETDFHTQYYEVRYIKTIRVFRQNDQPTPAGTRL